MIIIGVISNPEIVWAPLKLFARELIMTIIIILNRVIAGINKKIVNSQIASVKSRICPSKYGIKIKFISIPRNTKKIKLKRTDGIKATNTLLIINSLLEIGNNAKDSIVFLCFSPANESALRTALIIEGQNRK